MKFLRRRASLAGLLMAGYCATAVALDFQYHFTDVEGTNQKIADFIDVRGRIVKGDHERLLRILKDDPVSAFYVRSIRIASDGGDVRESLKLAETIRRASIPVAVVGPCASSCFFLYAGAVMRTVSGAGQVGIHRPYFPPELFRHLNSEEARNEMKAAHDGVRDFLSRHDIPVVVQEQMMQTDSDAISWLSPSDIKLIGMRPSYAIELLKARCPDNGRNADLDLQQAMAKMACEARELNREKLYFIDRLVGDRNTTWSEFKRKAGLAGASRPAQHAR